MHVVTWMFVFARSRSSNTLQFQCDVRYSPQSAFRGLFAYSLGTTLLFSSISIQVSENARRNVDIRVCVTIYCYVSGALRWQLFYFAMWGITLFTVFVRGAARRRGLQIALAA